MTAIREVRLDDQVYELREAAEFIRMSPDWLKQSDIPRSHLGRRIVFLKSELLAYVVSRSTHSLQEIAG